MGVFALSPPYSLEGLYFSLDLLFKSYVKKVFQAGFFLILGNSDNIDILVMINEKDTTQNDSVY